MALEYLVAEILRVAPSDLHDTTSQETLANWDSLAHVELITSVEEAYDVIFSTEEILDARSVGELRRILQSKGADV